MPRHSSLPPRYSIIKSDEPEIGDMDEGVVEGGEDTSDAEDELT